MVTGLECKHCRSQVVPYDIRFHVPKNHFGPKTGWYCPYCLELYPDEAYPKRVS